MTHRADEPEGGGGRADDLVRAYLRDALGLGGPAAGPPAEAPRAIEDAGTPPVSGPSPPAKAAEAAEAAAEAGGGSLLGRYPVVGKLGSGGMGVVLEVRDDDLGRSLAAKVILGAASPPDIVRFLREARITGQLEHPNIVPVHELGRAGDGRVYFTMKQVHGRTLRDLIGHGAPRMELLRIFIKVCDAVAFAHSRGVIHRDLKPVNVMVGEFGEVLVMDWGIAKMPGEPEPGARESEAPPVVPDPAPADAKRLGGFAEADTGVIAEHGRTVAVLGTPAYMPPEQANAWDGAKPIDARADVYALGAVLYQVLTGLPPYEGPYGDVMDRVRAGPPVPPRARAPGRRVPRELEAIVGKAMARRREDRYPTVVALRDDVQRWLDLLPVTAARYGVLELAAKWARRHATLVAAALAVVLVGLATAAVAIVRVEGERRRAESERARAEGERGRAETERGRAESERGRAEGERDRAERALAGARLNLSDALLLRADQTLADGRHLEAPIYLAAARRERETLRTHAAAFAIIPTGFRFERAIHAHPGGVNAVALHPDGLLFASAGADGRVRIFDTETGKEHVALAAHPGAAALAVAFSPDGKKLATGGTDGRARLFEVAAGAALLEHRAGGPVRGVAFAPGGGRVALAAGRAVEIIDAASGAEVFRLEAAGERGAIDLHAVAIAPDGRWLATGGLPAGAATRDATPIAGWCGLFDLEARALAETFEAGTQVTSVAFSPDGRSLAIGSFGPIQLVDTGAATAPRKVRELAWHGDIVTSVSFASPGLVLSSSEEGTVALTATLVRRDVRGRLAKEPEIKIGGHVGPVTSAITDGTQLFAGGADGRVLIFRIDAAPARGVPLGGRIASVAAPGAGGGAARSLFAVASTKGRAVVLEVKGDGLALVELRPAPAGEARIALSPDGSRLAVSGAAKTSIFEVGKPSTPPVVLAGIEGLPPERPAPVAFSPDGARVAVGRPDGKVSVYEVEGGRTEVAFEAASGGAGVVALGFSPSGGHLAVAAADGAVGLFALPRGTGRVLVAAGITPVLALAFAPDGRTLAVACGDARVRLIDVETGTGAGAGDLAAHGGAVHAVAFTPDGRLLATGSIGAVSFFDPGDGARLRVVRTPEVVTGLAFSPDGKHLLAGYGGGSLVLRGLAVPQDLAEAERRAGLRLRGLDLTPLED